MCSFNAQTTFSFKSEVESVCDFGLCGGSQSCATVETKVSLLILGSCSAQNLQCHWFFCFINDCCVFDSLPRHWFSIIWIKLQAKSVHMSRHKLFISIITHTIWPNYTFLILKSDYYCGKKAWRTWMKTGGEMYVRQNHHCECKPHTTWNCVHYCVHLHISFSSLFAFLLMFLHKTCALKCLHAKHQFLLHDKKIKCQVDTM